MNTNPLAKTILCYGDSNTWGAHPATGRRYPSDIRWPGVLKNTLGDSYYVIEEGLNGRTTMYDHDERPWRNGLSYIIACIHSHQPLDFIIIMLGTNDVKVNYAVPDSELGKGLDALMQAIISQKVGRDGSDPTFVLIAPPRVKAISGLDERMVDGPRKSALFATSYKKVADTYGCLFINAADVIESSSIDGYHLDEDAHEKLGKAVAEKIKELFT